MRQDVLMDAERRAKMSEEEQRAARAYAIALVREEIGHGHYETAKRLLPEIEAAIRKEFLPFVQRVIALAQTANAPLPQELSRWLTAITQLCDTGPLQLREGIRAYDALTFQDIVWKDGQQIDVNKRPAVIDSIRRLLRTHDGLLSALRRNKASVESWLKESNWPASGGARVAMVPADPPAPAPQPPVEKDFGV